MHQCLYHHYHHLSPASTLSTRNNEHEKSNLNPLDKNSPRSGGTIKALLHLRGDRLSFWENVAKVSSSKNVPDGDDDGDDDDNDDGDDDDVFSKIEKHPPKSCSSKKLCWATVVVHIGHSTRCIVNLNDNWSHLF